MILSSRLNKRVNVKQEGTTDTSIGARDRTSLVTIKKIWANKADKSVDAGYEDDRVVPSSYTQFITRYDPSINYDCVLNHNNRDYKIDHIQEIEDGEGLKIDTTTYGK